MATRQNHQHGSSTLHTTSGKPSQVDFDGSDWRREDMYAPESIDLLKNSGIDFKRFEEDGIDPVYFGELLITSGLVLFENVKWVSFHSSVSPSLLLPPLTLQGV